MYNVNELDNKIRRRLITIIIATVVLILVLIVAIVVVATTKSTNKNIGGENNTEFTMISDDNTKEEEPSNNNAPQNSSENLSSEETKDSGDTNKVEIGKISNDISLSPSNTVPSIKTDTSDATQDDSLPNTGPEDLLPLALVSGMLVTYLLSRSFVKKEN